MTQHTATVSHRNGRRPGGAWAGYLAAAWALVFALISVYWAAGGTLGVASVGAAVAGATSGLLVWAAAVLKFVGVAFSLALVRPWGRRLPRRPLLALDYVVSVLLMLYGAVNIIGELLVVTGAVAGGTDSYALHWHLYLWDPAFLLWGVCLFIAGRYYSATTRRPA